MKERPILFSTPMVQAIAEGRKTRTRRIIKLRNGDNPDDESISTHIDESFDKVMDFSKTFPYWQELKCPYGRPGDRLWVREEHYLWGLWQKGGTTKTGKRKWKFLEADGQGECLYSDNPPQAMSISMDKTAPDMPHWYKRLARFMPKKYARHHLLVTQIRAERLLDISDSDAIAEGIRSFRPVPGDGPAETLYYHYELERWVRSPVVSFMSLWDSIHGPDAHKQNPWVWVIQFERAPVPAP